LLQACKELIDDAKAGCVDLVFKEICLEILARAKSFLNAEEFSSLVNYASDRMQEKTVISMNATE
jgi:hypothetical protein